MTDVEDEDDWATSDELADDDNDSNAVVAESALDRYICLNIIISIRGYIFDTKIISQTRQFSISNF